MAQNKENHMITQWFPTKSYNVKHSNKNKQQQNDNVLPSSSQENMKSTNLPTKKQKWAHLEVLFGVWSIGFRVLKEPFFLIPFKGWMIFLPIESKKRWPLRRCHESAKNGSLEMGFKKRGLLRSWSRTQRSEVILREMNESKFRSLGKWFSKEEMVWEWRKWKWKKLVNSNNGERRESEEGELKKRWKQAQKGGQ